MRLNAKIRQFIFDGVMEHRLRPLDEKMEALEKQIGDELFEANFETFPIPEGASELDFDKWVGKTSSVAVILTRDQAAHEDMISYPKFLKNEWRRTFVFKLARRRFVERRHTHNCSVELDIAMKNAKFAELIKTLEQAARLRQEIRESVWPILLAPTTVAALVKVWPECKPFLPPETVKVGVMVPVGAVQKVNRLTGLPVEGSE